MSLKPVEWVLAVYYGSSAHRAVYGRLSGTKYTKDYIQLSRTDDFVAELRTVLGLPEEGGVEVTYKWPGGSAKGELVAISADRPHLKWETKSGAPPPWKMSLAPTSESVETIVGNPALVDSDEADAELELISERGGGQPYLVVIKLAGEDATLHLRVYLSGAAEGYSWADVGLLPESVRSVVLDAKKTRALRSVVLDSRGVAPSVVTTQLLTKVVAGDGREALDRLSGSMRAEVLAYLKSPGFGLFFDSDKRHDAWVEARLIPGMTDDLAQGIVSDLEGRMVARAQDDSIAEVAEDSPEEVRALREAFLNGDYRVDDLTATVKTRGSAQRIFSAAVKRNYGGKCAVTGISVGGFLVASHIVPWCEDQDIRLDPSNGICLSLLVDRAFELGYVQIEDNYEISLNRSRIGGDQVLLNYLSAYEGAKLRMPSAHPPRKEYLARRRALL